MAVDEIKLLGAWVSPYVIRIRMVLEQKGLSYEYLEQDLINKNELLLKHNPIHKKVPVLIHNDKSICESLIILQYIDEKWSGVGPSVLPADHHERAVARFWAMYIDDKLLSSFVGILKAMTEEAKATKILDTIAALEQLEGAFKNCSGGKEFFGGDTIGFLDVTLGCQLTWIKAAEKISGVKLLDETKVPLLVEWEKHFFTVDFVKRVLPSAERVEEEVRMLRATFWNVASANRQTFLVITYSGMCVVIVILSKFPPNHPSPLRRPPLQFFSTVLLAGVSVYISRHYLVPALW